MKFPVVGISKPTSMWNISVSLPLENIKKAKDLGGGHNVHQECTNKMTGEMSHRSVMVARDPLRWERGVLQKHTMPLYETF